MTFFLMAIKEFCFKQVHKYARLRKQQLDNFNTTHFLSEFMSFSESYYQTIHIFFRVHIAQYIFSELL